MCLSSSEAQQGPNLRGVRDPFVIRGRPEAPILENDTLPTLPLKQPPASPAYPELDYSNLLLNPELIFLFNESEFEVNMETLLGELEKISASEQRER